MAKVFSVDLPPSFKYSEVSDEGKREELEDYLRRLSLAIEEMLTRLAGRKVEGVGSYTEDNVATMDADGGVQDGGVAIGDVATESYVDAKTSCILGFASSGGVGIAAGTTKYAALLGGAFGTTNWHSTEGNRQHIVPYAFTAKNLYIRTTTAQPSAGNLVFTVRKNGAPTALTITVAADEAAGTKTDTTHTVTFAAGDLICLNGANGDGVTVSATINQWSLEAVK